MRTALEAELDGARQRVRDALQPLSRFVSDESERLRSHQQDLARLREGFEALRARIAGLR